MFLVQLFGYYQYVQCVVLEQVVGVFGMMCGMFVVGEVEGDDMQFGEFWCQV